MIFADDTMSIFGKDFSSLGNILRIMAAGRYVNVLTGSVGSLLIMTGHEREQRLAVLISAVMSVILSLILIPLLGLLGAAISYAIALAAQNLLSVYFVKKRLGFWMFCLSGFRF